MNGIIGEYTSKMSLRTEIRDGFHHLAEMFYTNPFGLMRFDKRSAHDPWLRYMIRSSTPGIMAGGFKKGGKKPKKIGGLLCLFSHNRPSEYLSM